MEPKIIDTGCKTWVEFKAAVHIICEDVPLTMLKTIYASMPKRVRLVVEKGGEKTGY